MKAKIIIVEDHEPIRNELKILLSKYGYEIIVLDRFDTVVEDCLREDVDLILLDINLPFYDGYYVCEQSEKNQKYRSLLLQVGIARWMS